MGIEEDRDLVAAYRKPKGGSWVVVGLIMVGLAVVGYIVLGMQGMTHRSAGGGGGMAGMAGMTVGTSSPPSDPRSLSPEEFEVRSAAVGAIVINVHVPFEGEIAGTDAFIPYDQVATGIPKLTSDRTAEILLYCKTGRMSSIAMNELVDLGYTNVSELAGGIDAWLTTAREVLSEPSTVQSTSG